MASQTYETIDRKFLDSFYRECGREVTLAYTVLNQTNTWAITFFGAVLGSSFIGLVKKEDGIYTFDYPNPFHWLYLILAWGLLLRFLQRSALALSNMYRWNQLGSKVWGILALPEKHPMQPTLNDKLLEDVDRLMMKWQDPRHPLTILWETLKLMYLGPVLALLFLILWGVAVLQKDVIYSLGVVGFLGWSALEAVFFFRWNRSSQKGIWCSRSIPFLSLFEKGSSCPPASGQSSPALSRPSPSASCATSQRFALAAIIVLIAQTLLGRRWRRRNRRGPR